MSKYQLTRLVWIDENILISDYSSNDESKHSISDDKTDEFLEFWTNYGYDTNIDDSTFKKTVFFMQNNHSKHNFL